MKTVTLQIGNSDDKLTQQEWSNFVTEMGGIVSIFAEQVHFHGGSPFGAPWQNAAWIFTPKMTEHTERGFRDMVQSIRAKFRQESVAVTIGETKFV